MKKIIILGLATLISFGSMASDTELEGLMDVFKITINDNKEEVVTKALSASPGDLLEYKITYKNKTEKTFSDISVIGKIPTGTTLVKNSDVSLNLVNKNEIKIKSTPVFSVDNGSTWSLKPTKKVIKDGNIVEVESNISDYNMIKWNIGSFKPNTDKIFKYRITVDSE